MCSVCPFPLCKYSYHSQFQDTKRMLRIAGLSSIIQNWLSCANHFNTSPHIFETRGRGTLLYAHILNMRVSPYSFSLAIVQYFNWVYWTPPNLSDACVSCFLNRSFFGASTWGACENCVYINWIVRVVTCNASILTNGQWELAGKGSLLLPQAENFELHFTGIIMWQG